MSTTTDITKQTICVERVCYYTLTYDAFVEQFCNDESEEVRKRMWSKMLKKTKGTIKSEDDMEEDDIDNFVDDIEFAVEDAKEQ